MVQNISPGLSELVRFSGMRKCSCAGSDRRCRVRLPSAFPTPSEKSGRCLPHQAASWQHWSKIGCLSFASNQKVGMHLRRQNKHEKSTQHLVFLPFRFHFLFSSRGWNLISLLANWSWLPHFLWLFLPRVLSVSIDTLSWLGSLCLVTKACCHQGNVLGQVLSTHHPPNSSPADLLIFRFSTCQVLTAKESLHRIHPAHGVRVCECMCLCLCVPLSCKIPLFPGGPARAGVEVTWPCAVAVLWNSGQRLSLSLFRGCPPPAPDIPLCPRRHFWWDNTNISHQLHPHPSARWPTILASTESFFSLTHIRLGTKIFFKATWWGVRIHQGVTPNPFQISLAGQPRRGPEGGNDSLSEPMALCKPLDSLPAQRARGHCWGSAATWNQILPLAASVPTTWHRKALLGAILGLYDQWTEIASPATHDPDNP